MAVEEVGDLVRPLSSRVAAGVRRGERRGGQGHREPDPEPPVRRADAALRVRRRGHHQPGRGASSPVVALQPGSSFAQGLPPARADRTRPLDLIQPNKLANRIRDHVGVWRAAGYDNVTPTTPQSAPALGRPGPREPRHLRQREAAETAIFLTEVAGAPRVRRLAPRLEPRTRPTTTGLRRVALKMATGAGKTVVMAMLIAWQTLNKVQSPRDARFTNRFLVVTPGHHDPRPAPRAAARGPRELLRPARPDPRRPQGRPRAGADRDHELPRLPAQGRQGDQGRRREHAPLLKGGRKDDPFKETPQADGEPRPARPRAGQAADHGVQRRGAPLLRGRAAREEATKADKEQGRERAGARLVPRPAGDRRAGRHQADLRPLGDARSTSRAPATTRATSSRGRSATSR